MVSMAASKGKLDLFGCLGLLSTFTDYLLCLIALTRSSFVFLRCPDHA